MNAGLLASDIGVLLQPSSDKLAFGDFVHGLRNATVRAPVKENERVQRWKV